MREAQACSSPGAVGRQVKILRRLSVVDTPVTRVGPTMAMSFRCGSVVTPNDDANLRVGQRVIDRRDQVVDRAFEALQERGGHAMGAGADVDRRRLERHPARHVGHLRVDVEQRHALAVDRHFHLLAGARPAEQEAAGVAVQLEPQAVVAVGRERVHDRVAAAGAERRAVDAIHLRRRLRHAVAAPRPIPLRGRRWPAPSPCSPRAGSASISVGENICESATLSNPALIVSAGSRPETSMSSASRSCTARWYSARFRRWNTRPPGRLASAARSTVASSDGHERRERGRLRTLRAGRRHHARAQLADDLLGDVHRLGRLRRRRTTRATARRLSRDRCGTSRRYLLARARSDRRDGGLLGPCRCAR